MTFDLLSLVLAFGGGFFAAAIGGLHAFIFTGFMVFVGQAIILAGGSTEFLGFAAFGPLFGPHISFAGGVAAVAYAARTGKEVGGKDIGVPLIGIERPDVLLVGGAFGMVGYVINFLLAKIPGIGSLWDSVALTVVLSGMIVRLVFGRSSIFGNLPEGSGWGRFAPRDDAAWVRWHEKPIQNVVLGLGAGLLAAGVTVHLAGWYPAFAANGKTFMFGVSAVSLLFLSLGLSFPVTHHMTIIAGLAALDFLPIVGNHAWPAIIIGAIAGMCSALMAELFARLWHDHGNTHIDPPAAAIWPMTLIVNGLAALFTVAA